MKTFREYVRDHRLHFIELLRIALGFILILQATHLMMGMPSVEGHTADQGIGGVYTVLAIGHLAFLINVVGGAFLIIGLLTRWVSLINIPQLLAATVMLGMQGNLFAPGSEFPFALLALIQLVVFAFIGGGPLSADYFLYDWSKTHEGGTFHAVWERWVHHPH